MIIKMNGFSVTIQRKNIKNINLRIQRTGDVQLSAPMRTPTQTIHHFLQEKHSWIEMHRYRLLNIEQGTPQQQLISGQYIQFQGIKYLIQINESQHEQSIQLKNNQIHFFTQSAHDNMQLERLLQQWYREQMQHSAHQLLEKWQAIMGVSINKLTIRLMKSRWGSCHPEKKHITLNLRLIEKPLICLEYVIVHELVHLFEIRHNQRFYALMSHYMPDWKLIKTQM